MKTLKIQTWLPVFPGFYGTVFEANEDYIIEAPYTSEDYDFDYQGYERDTAKASVAAIQEKLKDLGFACKIVFEQLRSPKEYNFSNDAIDVVFKISPAFIKKVKKYCFINMGDFSEYLERYKSCSGFISNYSSLFTDWLDYINPEYLEGKAHILGALLDFILKNEGFNEVELFDAISDSVYLDGELKESSIPTEFVLNDVTFLANYDDTALMFEYRDFYTELSFFDWCLENVKQLLFVDPNQYKLNF